MLGSIEVVVFPRDYERYSAKLTEENKVFVRGRVSLEEDKDGKLICERITSFDEIPRKLWIKFRTKEEYEKESTELFSLLSDSDGNDSVIIYIEDQKAMKKLPPGRNVNADDELSGKLAARYGNDNIRIVWDVRKEA